MPARNSQVSIASTVSVDVSVNVSVLTGNVVVVVVVSVAVMVAAGGVTRVDGVIVTTTFLGMEIVRAMVVVDT